MIGKKSDGSKNTENSFEGAMDALAETCSLRTDALTEDTPLYTAASSMTTEAFTQMNRDLNGAGLHILQVLFVVMLLAIGSIFMVNHIYGMGWMFYALAVLMPPLLSARFMTSIRRAYRTSPYRDTITEYAFYKDHFTSQNGMTSSEFQYSDIYQIREGSGCLYLLISANQAMRIDLMTASEGLEDFLRGLDKIPKKAHGWKLCGVLSMCAILMSSFTSTVMGYRQSTYVIRKWVGVIYDAATLLGIVAVILLVVLWNIYTIPHIRKEGKRILVRFFSLLVGFIIAAIFCWSGIVYELNPDMNGSSVKKNANGTYTVNYGVASLYGKRGYLLYGDGGPFYLKYLRPMRNEADVDPSISLQEWQAREYARKNEETGSNPSSENAQSSSERSSLSAGGSQSSTSSATENSSGTSAQDEQLKRIDDGYQMIRSKIFPDLYISEERYDAKGNSYYVMKEDASSLEYLMYDRDSKNGECGLYVLYQASKDSYGSYSTTDVMIDDIYAYNYVSGEVVDSGRKSWEDAGSEEYRQMTGE